MCSSHYLNYTCFYSLYTDITLKTIYYSYNHSSHHTSSLFLSLLTLGNRLRPLHLITHRLLPLGPMLLIQLQRRHSILQRTMRHTILLNDQSQLILRQHLQLLGNKVLLPSRIHLHKRLILGSIPCKVPRMRHTQHTKIILQPMPNHNLVGNQLQHLRTTLFKRYSGSTLLQILGCNPTHERAVVRHSLHHLDECVVDTFSIVVGKCDTSEAGVLPVWTYTDHFGV
mmetsp:Transcript_22959/g.34110  ORF Transcript_22959/g.34110 Transcript_22959/m.34110 type:complete len:226 (-) Transcript_22959:484-1161(-)